MKCAKIVLVNQKAIGLENTCKGVSLKFHLMYRLHMHHVYRLLSITIVHVAIHLVYRILTIGNVHAAIPPLGSITPRVRLRDTPSCRGIAGNHSYACEDTCTTTKPCRHCEADCDDDGDCANGQ